MKEKTNSGIEKAKFNSPQEEAYSYINSELGWNTESINLNKPILEKYFQTLFPGKIITFVNNVQFYISTDTGSVVAPDLDANKKILRIMTMKIKSVNDFDASYFKSKYIYIYGIVKTHFGSPGFDLRFAEFNPNKKTVSFTIDETVYEKFLKLSDKMAINKSKFIENKIVEFIDKNS